MTARNANPTEVTVGSTVVFHHEPPDGWWAESPDRPGCYAAGATLEECAQLWAESVELWGKP